MNWNVLHEPYPFNESIKKATLSALSFGLFIFLFLWVFQPFGLINYQAENKTILLMGYGLVTALVLISNYLIFSLFFKKWFSLKSWTVSKNILYTTWVFFTIGIGNLAFSVSQNLLNPSLNGYLFFQGATLLVGLIPVTISTFFVYNKKLSSALKQAADLNSSIIKKPERHDLVHIPSKNISEEFQLDLNNLLAIKAVENYIEVYYKAENELKKEVIRNALKDVSSALSGFAYIQQCHRSYLVNINAVECFSGNAQGLSLNFGKLFNFDVPVSRSFVASIKKQLSEK
ncbi:MAG: LytTR family transcriptional regulator [Bacteroidetes bacterium]|nr:MAG: LytTR family transcriptional regulator [Bacteroidota bacterium]MBL1143758.1 LytTR family transcriptional regulator [Bacteroidota bacterium]MCB0802609.1 LytTR family transcriptional regulator DNA-binding domain-containing protein [Flavobacteriales bacterium]NOG56559.1 LytTR family transcriptional regulator [Bacteroidota bacterium]